MSGVSDKDRKYRTRLVNRLARYMDEEGATAKDVAACLEISHNTVTRWLRGGAVPTGGLVEDLKALVSDSPKAKAKPKAKPVPEPHIEVVVESEEVLESRVQAIVVLFQALTYKDKAKVLGILAQEVVKP